MTDLIAHRGASSEEPENTLSAIRMAIDIGVDFIEMDVHLNANHLPVVIHDHTLCRTTNAEKGTPVRGAFLDYLKNLDAGSWFKGRKTEEQVPLLEEVLKLPLGKVGLMIELKDDRHHDLSRSVMRLLKRYPVHKVIIGSFSAFTLEYFAEHYPNLPLIGIMDNLDQIPQFRKLSIRHYAIDHELYEQSYHKSDLFTSKKLWAFTVDDYSVATRLISLGIQGIITNNPRALKPLMQKKSFT